MIRGQTKKRYYRYVCMMLVMGSIFLEINGCAVEGGYQGQGLSAGEADMAGAEGDVGIKETAGLPEIKITFFDVGKGDAILIETTEHKMMIDTGYDDTAGVFLDSFSEQGITKLDYLVLTHFDKDHVGGADHVLEAVEVGEVLQPEYESDSKQYEEYEETMETLGKTPVLVNETMRMSLDGAEILIYPPQQEAYEEEDNDFSLVVSMIYGEKSFLFAGDCEKERLEELMGQEEFDLSHNVLKVPHHGRKEKNSTEFFAAVSPDVAVITCSEEKPADEEVVEILEGLGTNIYYSTDGTVACFCDGEGLDVETAVYK
ncbi:MAG: MBL fold metallo-hydrolase [Kineothrix sp.]|nr:MBL fold metallo-hydrolase [Kineothrix sp.]NBI91017.1 MBL fold metallo-hydrolase [Lachnospiraceae bacterium]